MTLTPQQKADINRLRDNEMLTGDLTDSAATAVLAWAEGQLAAGVAYDTVVAGVKAANYTGTEDPALALAAANQLMAARSTEHAIAPSASDPPIATPRAKASRHRRAPAVTPLPTPAVSADAPFEDKLPLPTADEGPDDNHADDSSPPLSPPQARK